MGAVDLCRAEVSLRIAIALGAFLMGGALPASTASAAGTEARTYRVDETCRVAPDRSGIDATLSPEQVARLSRSASVGAASDSGQRIHQVRAVRLYPGDGEATLWCTLDAHGRVLQADIRRVTETGIVSDTVPVRDGRIAGLGPFVLPAAVGTRH